MTIRDAVAADVDMLADIWHQGWHDAHGPILPAELARLRTLESFRDRLLEALPDVRVAGPPAGPAGFAIVKGDELYQLYVPPASRGSGIAAALVADAEARLSERGVQTAWLACAIGNDRAARFYEKCGWQRIATMAYQAETSAGPVTIEVWRYERSLASPPRDAGAR
jgi:GNAT superfamily N-acetyltransferase